MRYLSKVETLIPTEPDLDYPPRGLSPKTTGSTSHPSFPEMSDHHLDDMKWLATTVSVVKKCKPRDTETGKPWCVYKHTETQPKGFPKHYPTKEEAERGLQLMRIHKKKAMSGAYYHVTPTRNVPSIMRHGLKPSVPEDMPDQEAVYVFTSREDAEDAVMNWLGDRFEDEPLSLLRIDAGTLQELNIEPESSQAGYEMLFRDVIPPDAITAENI